MDLITYSSDSYSLGWIECTFAHFKSLNLSQSQRYLQLLKQTNYKGDEKILNYISLVYQITLY